MRSMMLPMVMAPAPSCIDRPTRIQNVYQFWPRYHDPKNLTEDQRGQGLMQLFDDIRHTEPKVIIPLGNEALEALTHMKGISKWRGSVLRLLDYHIVEPLPDSYILPTYHPSAVIRSYDLQVLLQHDLKKAARLVRGEDVFPMERELITVNSADYPVRCVE